MSFSDYSLDQVAGACGLTIREATLFPSTGTLEPPAWLQESLEKAASFARVSEKARSEFIVAPILMAVRDFLGGAMQIFSGVRLDVDAARGLTGECDFILTRTPPTPVLQAPVLVILEAKKNDIEEGLGQCAAQLVAARIYNDQHRFAAGALFGCVTTGEAWHFLRLGGTELAVDAKRFFIVELPSILWLLTTIMRDTAVQKTDAA